jgi:hypothetical protein
VKIHATGRDRSGAADMTSRPSRERSAGAAWADRSKPPGRDATPFGRTAGPVVTSSSVADVQTAYRTIAKALSPSHPAVQVLYDAIAGVPQHSAVMAGPRRRP